MKFCVDYESLKTKTIFSKNKGLGMLRLNRKFQDFKKKCFLGVDPGRNLFFPQKIFFLNYRKSS